MPDTELDTAAVRWLYREAGRAGMAQVVVWGGEPLLRQDLPELLRAARRAGLFVTLITNGWFLLEAWPRLRGLVDALILSLDDTGAAHDRMRGLPGLAARLEAVVEELRADPLRPTLLLNTVLSRENRGALRRVAAVARRWGAGLYFCPMETGELGAGEAGDRLAGLALSPEELGEAASLALELKAAGYPVLASRPYLELLAADPALSAYTCRAPRARLTVGADGSVRDCLHVDRPLANVKDLRAEGRGLASLFAAPEWRRMAQEAASLHQVQQPGCDRTLVALGPAPRDARQGSRARRALTGARRRPRVPPGAVTATTSTCRCPPCGTRRSPGARRLGTGRGTAPWSQAASTAISVSPSWSSSARMRASCPSSGSAGAACS